VDDRLRGDAAADQAGAAETVGFDEDCVDPELARADRGNVTARAAADDEEFRFQVFGHESAFEIAAVIPELR
jgi:hypothetical protein